MEKSLAEAIDQAALGIEPRVIAWRRDIHQNPELGNREFRTSKLVEEHLHALGLEVRTGVAHTGLIALLRGDRPGGVVALRADMDALPISEEVELAFASRIRATYEGNDVGVMHACGHDGHVAILMGVAEILTRMKDRLSGTVKFIFQPAEEGAPGDEEGGAELMIKEGALRDPAPQAIFGLHIGSRFAVGEIGVKSEGAMASVDELAIVVRGRQTHGAYPWLGVDPVVVAAQIVLALQTIPSRQVDATVAPTIVTIGSIHGGVRNNIIPEQVELKGTIRALDAKMRDDLHDRIRRTAEKIAESAGATAEVRIKRGYPVTFNDPELTHRMIPTLKQVAGDEHVRMVPATVGGEDFSFFQQEIPGLFFFVGTRPASVPAEKAAANHSPLFFVEEKGLVLGVRALARLAVDFLEDEATAPREESSELKGV